MNHSLRLVASLAALAFGALSLTACGGAVDNVSPDTGPGTGGQTGGGKSCIYNGQPYEYGATFKASDGCNTCSCEDGAVACTEIGCVGGCTVGDVHYAAGDAVPSGDCNTCRCEENGQVSCTLIGCNTCEDVERDFANASAEAKRCDPGQPNQCTKQVDGGLPCVCDTFVNPDKVEALSLMEIYQSQYGAQACGAAVDCAPCLAPNSAHCSAEGLCVDDFEPQGGGASCKVEGVVYEDGATGVPDPTSCNTCTCNDGELTACTDIACPGPCPPSAVRGTQCAQCGPTDACEVVETTCLQMCAEGCANGGVCINGLCRTVCG